MIKLKVFFTTLLLLPAVLSAIDPDGSVENDASQVPNWVNAGVQLFEEAKQLDKSPKGLAERAQTIITSFADNNAEEHREKILETAKKVKLLVETNHFNHSDFVSMHFYLAAIVSGEVSPNDPFGDSKVKFTNIWRDLNSYVSEEAEEGFYSESENTGTLTSTDIERRRRLGEVFKQARAFMKDTQAGTFSIGMGTLFLGIISRYNDSSVDAIIDHLLPMYAATQSEGNLGVKPLLENLLEGDIPLILTPPGTESVHGGIIQTPFDMLMHDFIHGLLTKDLDSSEESRGFKQPLLSLTRSLQGASLDEQRKLLALFVLVHEFPANEAFKTPAEVRQELEEEAAAEEVGDLSDQELLQGFVQQNIDKIGTFYQISDDDLEQALAETTSKFLEKHHPQLTLEGLKQAFGDVAVGTVVFDGDQIHYQPGKVLELKEIDTLLDANKTAQYLLVDLRTNQNEIGSIFHLHFFDAETDQSVSSRADYIYVKPTSVRQNFQDYGKILQLAGLIPADRDFEAAPLQGEELTTGLTELMSTLPALHA